MMALIVVFYKADREHILLSQAVADIALGCINVSRLKINYSNVELLMISGSILYVLNLCISVLFYITNINFSY